MQIIIIRLTHHASSASDNLNMTVDKVASLREQRQWTVTHDHLIGGIFRPVSKVKRAIHARELSVRGIDQSVVKVKNKSHNVKPF